MELQDIRLDSEAEPEPEGEVSPTLARFVRPGDVMYARRPLSYQEKRREEKREEEGRGRRREQV